MRLNGAWTQRYEHGIPATDLEPVEPDGSTGTLVHFRPNDPLRSLRVSVKGQLKRLAMMWPHLEVQVDDRSNTGSSLLGEDAGP